MEKVTAIIPTFNRFRYLMNTINSIKEQTYPNIEIIVVNDCSVEKEYYEYNWEENGIIIIHLEENTKQKFGYPCVGYVINKGLEIYTGDYFSTCDDDDIWFPRKIELQIKAMKESGCKMSSTDGLIGHGVYDSTQKYQKYNAEHCYYTLQHIYRSKGSSLLDAGFPKIWTLDFLKIHNCIIACSVIIHRDVISKIGKKLEIKMGGALVDDKIVHIDYDYWLRALEHCNCVYVEDTCVYYDCGHGAGQNY
jgi:glycosyltransferase involved in cell wall biosynthesis